MEKKVPLKSKNLPASVNRAWKNLKKSKYARTSVWLKLGFFWLLAWLALAAFFLSGVLKDENYLETLPSNVVFPLAMHAFTALFIALGVWLAPKPKTIGAKTVVVLLLALCMVNYDTRLMGVVGIFRAVIPILPKPGNDIPLISLLFITLLFSASIIAGVFIDKLLARNKNLKSKNVAEAVAVLVGFLFLGQAIPTIKVFSQAIPQSKHSASTELKQASKMTPAKNAEKPDIYYIVLEDHVSNSVLKSQFNTNTDPFLDWLRSQNFKVDENANSNYPFTYPSMAASMNLGYVNDDVKQFKNDKTKTATLFFNMVQQAEVAKLLKQQGYTYNFLGNMYGPFNNAPLADNVFTAVDHSMTLFGHTKSLRSVEVNEFQQSPYYRFSQIPAEWWPLHDSESDAVSFLRNQLTALDQIANDKKQGGRFIFANILAPHLPSYLNADCSLSANPSADNLGEPVKKKYSGEIQCADTQIKKVIGDINKQSQGKAIVLLVSDEGQYPLNMNQTFLNPTGPSVEEEDKRVTNMLGWSKKDLQMKYGILQAVHIPQATEEDLQNMSSVNMFRIVLNRYFGYTFDYLPNCQMAVPGGQKYWYEYTDVSQKITGVKDASCKQYE